MELLVKPEISHAMVELNWEELLEFYLPDGK
jgi:hypothetical protein